VPRACRHEGRLLPVNNSGPISQGDASGPRNDHPVLAPVGMHLEAYSPLGEVLQALDLVPLALFQDRPASPRTFLTAEWTGQVTQVGWSGIGRGKANTSAYLHRLSFLHAPVGW